MPTCVVYDSKHIKGATATIAECIGSTMRDLGFPTIICRVGEKCPDHRSCDLVIVGSPIYYEHPMRSVIRFIEENNNLENCRIAVFITCYAASKRIPAPIRYRVVGRYLGLITEHVRGDVIDSKAFKGWLRKPDMETLRECREWCYTLLRKLGIKLSKRVLS